MTTNVQFPYQLCKKRTLYFYEIRESLAVNSGLKDFRQGRMRVDYALKLA